jgi:GntR family transcriptional regulator
MNDTSLSSAEDVTVDSQGNSMSGIEVVAYVVPGDVDVSWPPWECLYIKIAKHVAGCIAAARLHPGQRLPSEYALAEHYAVSIKTLRHAMEQLRAHGVIITQPGVGTFIAPDVSVGDNALVQLVAKKKRERS